ncbi:MAG TPA: hypothetical protein DEG17_13420 [Cyanobacteria bacterium UBA11149]|nr:hypothetical protein [Cyanobacteria bacterium UBA11367]HBE59591.1 hypothetical protein [Cyanobacteria bacterium UBA11366]HBK66305.1 hypothetical protein [Cyanobacteria bacterium UBA11166]HBR75950.1 hypothetical protein [Cyanobacteria bacterium UBA11159]HBS68036.1 hypothetical protein [Cyanobacteria bacterium UBA11153]HBW89841.1 hypothetical protein [Cyanobacteria bacterium UBA11149]HCA98133.1 hypothetical protein [Cyanobacteria bacterium UBA9226]
MFTDSIFGWLIAKSQLLMDSDKAGLLWLLGAGYIMLIVLALTAPLTMIQSVYANWLKSDTRALLSIIFSALLAVILIRWIQIFIRILVLVAAGALARLDLQVAGCNSWQALRILTVFSLTGYSLGILAHQIAIAIF